MRLTFRLDKHKQLRITANADFEVSPKEPDILTLTQDETEELRTLLSQEVVKIKGLNITSIPWEVKDQDLVY